MNNTVYTEIPDFLEVSLNKLQEFRFGYSLAIAREYEMRTTLIALNILEANAVEFRKLLVEDGRTYDVTRKDSMYTAVVSLLASLEEISNETLAIACDDLLDGTVHYLSWKSSTGDRRLLVLNGEFSDSIQVRELVDKCDSILREIE